jgi:hypothetical protein
MYWYLFNGDWKSETEGLGDGLPFERDTLIDAVTALSKGEC